MNVISASRRTDIPAFYSEWLMNRIRAGFARWRNPFSGKICEASLRQEDVSAIAFWSRDYRPLLPHLDELDSLGHAMIFHFTITNYPSIIEPHVPDAAHAIESARFIANRYSPQHIIWRYDPILISSETDIGFHIRNFERLSRELAGSVARCYTSYPMMYRKTVRSLENLARKRGITFPAMPEDELKTHLSNLADICNTHGISLHTCCNDHLLSDKILKAKCIDRELMQELFPQKAFSRRSVPTRKECGCIDSRDIGAYDTCPHGCAYCYANSDFALARKNLNAHSPAWDMIDGDSGLPDAAPKHPTLDF